MIESSVISRGPFAIGSAWGEGVRLLLRSAPVVIVAMAAMAEACILLFDLISHCFASWSGACSPGIFLLLGAAPADAQRNAIRFGFEFAAFVIIAPATYAMFSSRRFAGDGARLLSGSARRTFRFLGRIAVYWIIVSVPVWLGEIVSEPVTDWLSVVGVPRVGLIAVYFGIVLLSLLGMSALRVRLAFYLPSAAYDAQPWTLGRCWRAPHAAFVRLFAMFFLVDAATVVIEIAIVLLCYRFFYELNLDALVHWLRRSYGGEYAFVARTLPEVFVFVFEYPPASLLQAALSVIAYRRLAADGAQTIAMVFD